MIQRVFVTIGIILFVFILVFPQTGYSQKTGKVEGIVTVEKSGNTLEGVNLVLEGIGRGTATLPDGSFELTFIHPGTYILWVCSVGYKSSSQAVKIQVGETTRVQLTLLLQLSELKEIVVTRA